VNFRLTDHAHRRLDFTPWIPCALVVIVFFLLTFHDARDNAIQRSRLPGGELARPTAEATSRSVVMQLTGQDTVIVGGEEVPLSVVKLLLDRERSAAPDGSSPAALIRADANTPTGKVQELILIAQQAGFERILLRAQEETRAPSPVIERKGG
jgi:biopolymer transport protein ExbD